MYFLGTAADGTDQMGLASSSDLLHWTEETKTPVLPRRPGMFDSRVVEPGPAPVLTPDGIVLIYNGADDKLVYRTGVAVFDRKDPRKVLYRSEQPIFAPQEIVGESWPGAERGLRGGDGPSGQAIPFLLRRSRQVRWSGRSAGATVSGFAQRNSHHGAHISKVLGEKDTAFRALRGETARFFAPPVPTRHVSNMALISLALAASFAKSKVPCSRISRAARRKAPSAVRESALPTLTRFTPIAESSARLS